MLLPLCEVAYRPLARGSAASGTRLGIEESSAGPWMAPQAARMTAPA